MTNSDAPIAPSVTTACAARPASACCTLVTPVASTHQTLNERASSNSATSATAAARRVHGTLTVRTGPAGAGGGTSAGGKPTVSAFRA